MSLLELMIVLAIIAILLSVAIPVYSRSLVAAHERALRADLQQLRNAIWHYTLDKQKGPQSLDELVTAGYLPKIPNDPMTGLPNWEPQQEEILITPDEQDPGVDDVHSASSATATDGTAYNTW